MAEAALYQYLQPLTYVIYALGFGFIRFYIPNIKAASYFGAGYLVGCVAVFCEIRWANSPSVSFYSTAASYYLMCCIVTMGIAVRVGQSVPLKRYAGLTLVFLILLSALKMLSAEFSTQLLVVNFMAAAIIAIPLPILRDRSHILIDKILFWLLAIIVMQLILRSSATYFYEGASLTLQNYPASLTSLSLRFSVALSAIALAVTLYVALGIDIVYALKKQSTTDGMTGLRNRAGFEAKARKMIEAACEKNAPLCLVITDLDRFKQVNDTKGHATGDVVIGFFGRILGNMARKSDLAARVGGEEFCVLLNDCSIADAVDLTDAVRQAFNLTPVPGVEPELICSASFGIAALRGNEGLSELYKRADEALYRAKNEGRNRVVAIDNYHWRPSVEAPPLQPDLARRATDHAKA